MIKITLPESCGNANRLILDPPKGATFWHVFRSIHKDMKAPVKVYEGTDDLIMDTLGLGNGVEVFYQVEYRMPGGTTQFSNVSHATPQATYEDYTTDTLELLRDRLEAGLMEEVKRGVLVNELGYIQVLTAPPSLQNNLAFPLVTLLLESESPSERSINDVIDDEDFDDDSGEHGMWVEQHGWIANVNISITGWSLNPTERISLRKALRRVLIANFDVFAGKGVILPQFTLSDSDAVSGEFDAPLYLVTGDFSCQAPIRVGQKSGVSIIDIVTEVNANG